MRDAKHTAILFSISLTLIVAIKPAISADGSGKPTLVRMALAARSTTTMPYFVAKERGYFRDEGLEVELIIMQAIQTIQATMGNSTQFASATGSAVSAAVSGADMRVILAVTDQPSFDLIVQPGITSVQQLRGKKIGTGGVGSLAEILARRILIANKVPLEAVAILATGPSHVTYTALKAKVIRCRAAADAVDFHRSGRRLSQARGRRRLLPLGARRPGRDQNAPDRAARARDQSGARHAAGGPFDQDRPQVRPRISQGTLGGSGQKPGESCRARLRRRRPGFSR
jgi:NitT/TauT family transport system substrate-binding protein